LASDNADTDATKPRPRRLWRRLLILAFCLAAILCGCNTLAGVLVKRADARAPRDPETGILIGAEPRDLGLESADRAVLFVHGFAGAGNNFADLPERVAEQGWRVRGMRLPGHGTSPRDMETVTPDELVEAVLAETRSLRESHSKVVLVGHSMGGALSTIVEAQEPVDGLILGGAYFGVTYRWYYILKPEQWIRIGTPFMRWVYKGQLFLQVNKKEVKDDIVAYTWLPARSGLALSALGRRASSPAVLDNVTCPVLMLHAPGDIAASPECAQQAFDAMASQEKRLVWLERSNHHVFWDYDQKQLQEAVLEFLNNLS
jgi:carboxylesterase